MSRLLCAMVLAVAAGGARVQGHEVAFFLIRGDPAASDELRRAILRALESAPGAQRGSARVSLENSALSLAYDPKRASLAAVQRSIERKLAARRLGVDLLRVLKGSAS